MRCKLWFVTVQLHCGNGQCQSHQKTWDLRKCKLSKKEINVLINKVLIKRKTLVSAEVNGVESINAADMPIGFYSNERHFML